MSSLLIPKWPLSSWPPLQILSIPHYINKYWPYTFTVSQALCWVLDAGDVAGPMTRAYVRGVREEG